MLYYFNTTFSDKIFAALPKVERGVPVRLSGDPKGQNFLYCHGNSVYIRNIDVRCLNNFTNKYFLA